MKLKQQNAVKHFIYNVFNFGDTAVVPSAILKKRDLRDYMLNIFFGIYDNNNNNMYIIIYKK
jgi:hypothetical protein